MRESPAKYEPVGEIVWEDDTPYEPKGEVVWEDAPSRVAPPDNPIEVEQRPTTYHPEHLAALEDSLAREDAEVASQESTPVEEGEVDTGIGERLEEMQGEARANTLSFLRGSITNPTTGESFGMEGFSEKTYDPGGENSGVTIGTGIDLKHHNKQGMIKAGVPEEIAEKLSPYYGKDDKDLLGQTPLTKEELEIVDSAVLKSTEDKIRKKIPTYDNLPQGIKNVLVMTVHQYGAKKAFKYKLFKQIKNKEWGKALNNLSTWSDITEGLGSTIAKKYQAMGETLKSELDWLLEEESYKSLKNGWYKDPDTGEKFEVVDGRRM